MSALPDGWEIPRWNDPAPVPCTKVMLIAWLNARHGHQIPDDARMGDLCEVLETAYDARLPNTGGGAYPATMHDAETGERRTAVVTIPKGALWRTPSGRVVRGVTVTWKGAA
jgi:hypothetical protein